ncbi:MAG: cell division protein SepF [Acetobacter sp.]|nr:cell division protein SepF [Bacteroides sp.]MCM1340240.1 cell division protein SepF [Acetobacter sp.]MCM1432808.1 cell division protein SepF [Clostridiales bacterium]
MSFNDFLKKVVGDRDDEFDELYDEDEDTSIDIDPPQERRSSRRERERSSRSGSEERYTERSRVRRHESDKVVNIHTTTQLQVVLAQPEKYDEAAGIANNLTENRAVVLNLEHTNHDIARRLLDFLTGAAYVSNGQIKRVANGIYLVTPYNVDVMGDLLDELENNGIFM